MILRRFIYSVCAVILSFSLSSQANIGLPDVVLVCFYSSLYHASAKQSDIKDEAEPQL
jgi:hypothetical protein